MCNPVLAVAALTTAATVASQQSAAKKAADSQDKATAQATAQASQTAADNKTAADKAALDADMANNRANGKQPDAAGMSSKNQLDAKGGISGTMLTGPQGVDPNSLLLGKSTLLGG